MKEHIYEILVSGVVFDTASNQLSADAIKHLYTAIGWKNVTTQPKQERKS
jgi:hypothetical protein